MKRLLSLLCAVALCLTLSAKHLEFMGIPLDGSITNFQTKLKAKGCTLMRENNTLPAGIRGFDGSFAGKKSDIFVYFNPTTKKVYKARAVIDCYTRDGARDVFDYFKNLLKQKYEGQSLTSDDFVDQDPSSDTFEVLAIEPPIQEGTQVYGVIEMFIDVSDDYPKTYKVFITYTDWENNEANDSNNMNDL